MSAETSKYVDCTLVHWSTLFSQIAESRIQWHCTKQWQCHTMAQLDNGTAGQWLCQSMELPDNGTARQWHCQTMALPDNGTPRQRHCQTTALPDNGTARQWHCQTMALHNVIKTNDITYKLLL